MNTRALLLIAAFGAGLLAHPALTAQSPGRRVIQPERFPYMGLPYSPAILAGDTMYLAGQLGRDPSTTKLAPGGIEGETRQVSRILPEGSAGARDSRRGLAQPRGAGRAADDRRTVAIIVRRAIED